MRIIGNDPNTPRETQVVASGALSTGDPVIVLADGSVQVVSSNTITQSATTPVLYESGNTSDHGACYDTVNNKVVVVYDDEDNNNYGTAVVGTVSNGTITFGTPVTFESSTTVNYCRALFDPTSQRVIIGYRPASTGYPTLVVGEVSGTTISFGTSAYPEAAARDRLTLVYDPDNAKPVLFFVGSATLRGAVATIDNSDNSITFGTVKNIYSSGIGGFLNACYDTDQNQILIAYADSVSDGQAIRVTVSGTTISSASGIAEWEAGTIASDIGMDYDPVNQKAVIFYRQSSLSSHGTAIVVTNTGSGNLTYGTKVVFNSATTNNTQAIYDSTSGKFLVVYRDGGNSNYGTFISGAVSGTSITFDSEYVFESATALNFGLAEVIDDGLIFVGYKDNGNTGKGTATLVTVGYTDNNLTSENFVGFAKADAVDGGGVAINTQGAVDEGQSSLTAGQAYYVQNDGTLGTTADSPSVFAGTAVDTTKLIVKG